VGAARSAAAPKANCKVYHQLVIYRTDLSHIFTCEILVKVIINQMNTKVDDVKHFNNLVI